MLWTQHVVTKGSRPAVCDRRFKSKSVLNKRITQNKAGPGYRSWFSISSFCQPFGLSGLNWTTRGDADWLQMAYCTAIMRTKSCQLELSFRIPCLPGQRLSPGGLETELRSLGKTRRYSCQNTAVYLPISSHSADWPRTRCLTSDTRQKKPDRLKINLWLKWTYRHRFCIFMEKIFRIIKLFFIFKTMLTFPFFVCSYPNAVLYGSVHLSLLYLLILPTPSWDNCQIAGYAFFGLSTPLHPLCPPCAF